MPFIWSRPVAGGPRISRKHLVLYMLIFIVAPIITYTGGRWLDKSLGFLSTPPFPWNLITGSIVFFTGLAIGIKATRQLYLEGLGLPWGEASNEVRSKKLVNSGLYAYTRNPMILGYSALPGGMGLMFQSPSMTFLVPLIVVAVNVVIVRLREEPNLEDRFGEEYQKYREATPFLIPHSLIGFLRCLIWDQV